MRSNVEQYIILLESQVTPEHLRVQIRNTLLILGELADTVNSDPLMGGFAKEDEAEQEGKEIYSGAVTSETVVKKPKRARTKKGRYQADDKSTPDVNEAWSGGKSPIKKAKPKKKTVKVTRTTQKK